VSAVVYARVPDSLKLALEARARERGLTLTGVVVELLERGLEATGDEGSRELERELVASANELERARGRLAEPEAGLEVAREREEINARTLRVFAERARHKFASCPYCLRPLRGYDLLVVGHCPNCDRAITALLTQRSPRFLHFEHLLELVENVPGDIVECGVGAGKSLFMLGLLTEDRKHPRRLWGFDSFQGLPAPAHEDEPDSAPKRIKAGKYAHSEAEVRARMISNGISETNLAKRFVFVQGYFPTSFPQYAGKRVALLHLDVDLYQSYKDCLEWFEPKVARGGAITCDEYRQPKWIGATRAIEEYYGGPPPGIQKSPHWDRWFWIKP
jgi:hypothetical protein